MPACKSVYDGYVWSLQRPRGHQILWNSSHSCELPRGRWESNPSPGRTASALSHWAISSAPHASLFLWLPWMVFNTLESFQRRKLYLQDPLSIKSWLTCTLCKTALYGWDKNIKLRYYVKIFNHTFSPKDSSSHIKGRCPKRYRYNKSHFWDERKLYFATVLHII